MFRRQREIWYSFAAALAVTAVYALVYWRLGSLPAAASLFGHAIGVVGILLMLTTEVAYSIRKRSDGARWGSMAAWLRFHIFTGLVGPYMVLLHAAMSFRGLAGVSMLLTVFVVASGVTGRYIYTQAPHSVGTAVATADVPGHAGLPAAVPRGGRRSALAVWRLVHVPLTWVLFATAFVHAGAALYYATLQR